MIIKEPCIIDTSHWDVPIWDILDARVMGVIMKATQGRYYVDPTFASQWIGAGGAKRPRSAFHFMELNDVSAQVENFLTACEDAGAIVSGRWVGEIEPVLDAEIELTSAAARLSTAIGLTKPKLSQKKLMDLREPARYLVRNPSVQARSAVDLSKGGLVSSLLGSAVTGPQLAAQYKAWLDLVEAELHVRPIVYSSKWMLAYAGNPAWINDYKGWWAQYPNDPDGQDAPAYLPINATDWWMWQYSDKGQLAGFIGDVNVFNGSHEEWAAETGGEVVPPEPPIEGEMMEITPKDSIGSRVRSGPGTLYPQIGSLAYGQKKEVVSLQGTAGSEQWALVDFNGEDGWIAVWYQGAQTAVLSGTLPPVGEPMRTHVIEVFSDGTIAVDGDPRI